MMQTLQNHLPDLIQAASLIISLAAILAALTPTPTDNAVLIVARKIIDFAALNWGHAKNAEKARLYDAEVADRTAPAARVERIDRPL